MPLIAGVVIYNGNSFVFQCNKCKLEFDNIADLQEHFIDEETEKVRLRHLHDEVIEYIFQYLPPNDLANMSLTNRANKNLVENYFLRVRNDGQINIAVKSQKVQAATSQFYERKFRSFIGNVTMKFTDPKVTSELFQFMRSHCAQKIRKLTIELRPLMRDDLVTSDFDLISDQIRSLKILKLKNVNRSDQLLRYCDEIKVLLLRDCSDVENDAANVSITETHPSLKVFIMEDRNPTMNLSVFLHNNPQLKVVAMDCETSIRNLFENETLQLSYAAVKILEDQSLEAIWDNFRRCRKENRIDAIEFVFVNCPNINKLSQIFETNCVKGFHTKTSDFLSEMRIEYSYGNIERLCIRIQNIEQFMGNLDKIVKCFPKLHELHLGICSIYENYALFDILLAFVKQTNIFNRIYVGGFGELTKDQILELSAARSASGSILPFYIYIDPSIVVHVDDFEKKIRIGMIEMVKQKSNCGLCSDWFGECLFQYLKCVPQLKSYEKLIKFTDY